MQRYRAYVTVDSITPSHGGILSLDVEVDEEDLDRAESAIKMAIPHGEIRTITVGDDDLGDVTLDLGDIEALAVGPQGYQGETGFRLVGGEEGVGAVVVPTVLCASDRQPTPQHRYVSPYELERGVLEVADRLHCVRVHGELVVGRTDDIAEVAGRKGRGLLARLGERLRRRLGALIQAAVGSLGARLP